MTGMDITPEAPRVHWVRRECRGADVVVVVGCAWCVVAGGWPTACGVCRVRKSTPEHKQQELP